MIELQYAYFGRTKDNKQLARHDGIMCVAYTSREDDTSVSFSVAFCSPQDSFSRKKAHAILQGRFNNKQLVTVPIAAPVSPKERSYKSALAAISTYVSAKVSKQNQCSDRYICTLGDVKVPRWFSTDVLAA